MLLLKRNLPGCLLDSACLTTFILLFFFILPVHVINAAPPVNSYPLPGPAPVINGTVGETEWDGAFELHLIPADNYPIETYVYFLNDNSSLYVLVDAVGDATDSIKDECLMVFGLPPNYHVVEIWGDDDSGLVIKRVPSDDVRVASERGFGPTPADNTNHRFYEFKIDFDYIGINPGDPIEFYSPAVLKSGYFHYASMPYDGDLVDDINRDNVFPHDLVVVTGEEGEETSITSATGYATLETSAGASIPALNEWGVIIMVILLAGFSIVKARSKNS